MGDDSNKVFSYSDTKKISEILKEVSFIDDFSKKSSKLEFYVHALELEMTKIDAFKRELPHSMSLLKDAIERLKEEGLQWKGKDVEPVIDKKNWMSSAQLWSTPVHYGNNFDIRNQDSILHQKLCSELFHRNLVDCTSAAVGALATPKQIREHMKVDGLTNDEVKSHLQKYRLHIRKLPTSSTDVSSCSRLTQDPCKAIVAQSGSPQSPLHPGGSPKGLSATDRGSMEEEDDKSESHSWKGLLHKPVDEQ
ncbi:unnamed protein product [Fraxinus pennsylvanica]|uniref:HHO5-like N-terminal domain-containing protein n=1 Tax=Fraxinus pennsylvanica TaxID=56036 RepID=A0AAD2A204_9LAMI|nr:unnamed protein product [Fraxinus pennsylvanica]